MCRLFGMLSVKPRNATNYLFSDPCSLFTQSTSNPLMLQSDGWGIGFYVNGSLKVLKSSKPVYEESECFKRAAESIKSSIIVAHIRRASNPRGLSREKLISIENSQPFYYENYVFAHNGAITIPDEAAELLGKWKMNIRSLNDSEIYFWYIIKEIYEERNIMEALRNFERDLYKVWAEVRDKHPSKTGPYTSLNMIFSNGRELYAYCKYEEEKLIGSLCYGDQPLMRMVYIANSDKFIVSSEKTNLNEKWEPFENGQLITARVENGKIALTKMKIRS